jgi:three-Cys-motif partner protein
VVPPLQAIDFFQDAKIASLRKLDVYGKYLQPLSYKWGAGWRHHWIVDGFAGAGAYDEADQQDGSPLIAAKWARTEEQRCGYPKVKCINVERDPACFYRLTANLAPWAHLVSNLRGEFGDHLEQIIEKIGRDPAFFFLDPFGVRGIEMPLIEKIMQRPGRKTELLIHFSERSFARMAGHASEGDRATVAERMAQSKLARLDEVIGSQMWRPWWAGGNVDPGEALEKTIDLYMSQLRTRGFDFVNQIAVRDKLADRSRYRLVFCTSSPHGVDLMSDIACRYERGLADEAAAGQDTLFTESEDRQSEGDLIDAIHKIGLERQVVTREKIRHLLATREFGKHTITDYNRAIVELVKRGGIDRETAVGIQEREELHFKEFAQSSLLEAL